MRQLSALDAAFLGLETPRSPMHVGTVGLYDDRGPAGPLTRGAVVEHIAPRLHLSATFRQKVVPVPFGLDRPYWVEDEAFDLEAHVHQHTLPAPGDRATLWAEAARIIARPLDLTRPPWELWVLDGLSPSTGASVALVAKVHHAAVDGLSGMEILAAIHDRHQRPRPVEPPPPAGDASTGRRPSDLELLARATANLLTAPMRLNRAVQEAQPQEPPPGPPPEGPRTAAPRLGTGAPRTRFNGLVTSERVVAACTFPAPELRRVQALAPGSSANDVVLAIVGGALRRHLGGLGELPEASLVAMAPLTLRSRADAGGGNRVSAMFVRLGTDLADPVERLRAVSERTRRSKGRARGRTTRRLLDVLDVVPLSPVTYAGAPTWVAMGGMGPPANTVVTNVPLGRRPIYLAGARLLEVHGTAPVLDGAGLMHVVLTYSGTTSISVTSCPTMLPDVHGYVGELQASFDELRAAVPDEPVVPPGT